MDLSNIHFHDTGLLRVVEDTEKDTLTFEVDYPTNWETNTFDRRWIIFDDVLDYRAWEGPFHGSPTILDVQIVRTAGTRSHLRIETNAGFRELSCVQVRLLDQPPAANKSLNSPPDDASVSYRTLATNPHRSSTLLLSGRPRHSIWMFSFAADSTIDDYNQWRLLPKPTEMIRQSPTGRIQLLFCTRPTTRKVVKPRIHQGAG